METEIRVVEAEALRVGPSDVLIVRLPDDSEPEFRDAALAALEKVGLGDRSLVVCGVELAVAARSST